MMLLPKFSSRNRELQQAEVYRKVLRDNAKMGGTLFGPIPAGHRREFFCLDAHTWVWHEEWVDTNNKAHAVTTRYDIRPNGVLKSQGHNSYQKVDGDELRNLYQAARLYRERLRADYVADYSLN
jgi:hypothetical protein